MISDCDDALTLDEWADGVARSAPASTYIKMACVGAFPVINDALLQTPDGWLDIAYLSGIDKTWDGYK